MSHCICHSMHICHIHGMWAACSVYVTCLHVTLSHYVCHSMHTCHIHHVWAADSVNVTRLCVTLYVSKHEYMSHSWNMSCRWRSILRYRFLSVFSHRISTPFWRCITRWAQSNLASSIISGFAKEAWAQDLRQQHKQARVRLRVFYFRLIFPIQEHHMLIWEDEETLCHLQRSINLYSLQTAHPIWTVLKLYIQWQQLLHTRQTLRQVHHVKQIMRTINKDLVFRFKNYMSHYVLQGIYVTRTHICRLVTVVYVTKMRWDFWTAMGRIKVLVCMHVDCRRMTQSNAHIEFVLSFICRYMYMSQCIHHNVCNHTRCEHWFFI